MATPPIAKFTRRANGHIEMLGRRFQKLTAEDLSLTIEALSFSVADSLTEGELESVDGSSVAAQFSSLLVFAAGVDKAENHAALASSIAAWRSHSSACSWRTLFFSAKVGAPARCRATRSLCPPAKMLGPAMVALLAQVAPERSSSRTFTPLRWLLIMLRVHGSSVSIFKPRVNFRTHFEHEPSGAQCTRKTRVTSASFSRDMLAAEVEPLMRFLRKVTLMYQVTRMRILSLF